jgi:hypothetical protein
VTPKLGRLTAHILITALSLSGVVACAPQMEVTSSTETGAATATEPTIFKCKQYGESRGTFAQLGNVESRSPVIAWNTTEFGSEYTPERRCEIVSERLTDAVAKNGGRLSNLSLKTGRVDTGQTVVCVVTQESQSCNRENMLFTLSQKNAQNPNQALANIIAFSRGEESTVIEGGLDQSLFSLQELVNKNLPKTSGF